MMTNNLIFMGFAMFFVDFTSFIFNSVVAYTYIHMHVGAQRGQRHLHLELELRGVVNCLMWVLGTQIRSPARAMQFSTN